MSRNQNIHHRRVVVYDFAESLETRLDFRPNLGFLGSWSFRDLVFLQIILSGFQKVTEIGLFFNEQCALICFGTAIEVFNGVLEATEGRA